MGFLFLYEKLSILFLSITKKNNNNNKATSKELQTGFTTTNLWQNIWTTNLQ